VQTDLAIEDALGDRVVSEIKAFENTATNPSDGVSSPIRKKFRVILSQKAVIIRQPQG
jgi:hypothetical protein